MKVLVILSGSIAIKKTDELFNLLKKENIKNVTFNNLFGGIVCMHRGWKI